MGVKLNIKTFGFDGCGQMDEYLMFFILDVICPTCTLGMGKYLGKEND